MTTVPIPSSSACYGGTGMMWRSPPMSVWLAAASGSSGSRHPPRAGDSYARTTVTLKRCTILLSQSQADIMEAFSWFDSTTIREAPLPGSVDDPHASPCDLAQEVIIPYAVASAVPGVIHRPAIVRVGHRRQDGLHWLGTPDRRGQVMDLVLERAKLGQFRGELRVRVDQGARGLGAVPSALAS